MQIKKTIAVGAVSLAALLAGGAALAAGNGSTPKSAGMETTTGADTDNVQQGDQTSPDVNASIATNESEGTGSETESNQEGSSDGPRGHQDPPGNVDHQFQGEE
jgi:hypothetical protein